ncbi:low molecular weight phosphotyrosine protein phosphatase [Nocardioides sp. dk4132]|uniref:low molecular weight protein-tyrosine-phosphatase n=1 Tax=unclassified Nocardioides TaxID=2615069 RepID=UPI001296A58E|nr:MULTISPECIES: low molecular weight protein-tyrosine-phosphatase [unclassified Nocardioides]MQW76914.1 low molecular weight phosphotyrosine protein phosphatase [Nocardioides sp. dk4132]QGA09337.1 low molecular weight phosphotyrosine protein phosphatase [Nocardioides sp. dk884]
MTEPVTGPAAPALPPLPSPRTPGRYAIALVCLGNICRSPTADVVLSARLAEAGLDDRVEVASCGTGGWHVGEPMDRRAAATLRAVGLDPSRHRARQWTEDWRGRSDLVLAMDSDNLAALGGRSERVRLFRDLDPIDPGGEVPDPYYGGDDGFEEVLAMVERTSAALVAALREILGPPTP